MATSLERLVMHHDALIDIEDHLETKGLLVDINRVAAKEGDPSADHLNAACRGAAYVRGNGRARLDDFKRLDLIASRFDELLNFIARCAVAPEVQESPEYQQLEKKVESARRHARRQPEKTRDQAFAHVADAQDALYEVVRLTTSMDPVPEWLLTGIRRFVDIFLPDRIIIRVTPVGSSPAFSLQASLKRTFFVDDDMDNVLFAYGSRPNVDLTVLGLVSSIPSEEEEPGTPQAEGSASSEEALERAFIGVFDAMNGFEAFTRFSRYPRVTLYPIAVYRNIEPGS